MFFNFVVTLALAAALIALWPSPIVGETPKVRFIRRVKAAWTHCVSLYE